MIAVALILGGAACRDGGKKAEAQEPPPEAPAVDPPQPLLGSWTDAPITDGGMPSDGGGQRDAL